MKKIKTTRIISISTKIRTKEGKELYFVDFEGSFVTEDIKDINDSIDEVIKHYQEMKQ